MRSFCIGRSFDGKFTAGHCNPLGMPEDLGYMVEVETLPPWVSPSFGLF
jgi:hypothetical protein